MAGNYTKDEKRYLKALGQALKEKRVAQGFSQEKLAEITGLHRTYVGSVERGERNVSALNIKVIAGKLDCHASELFRMAEAAS